jgi:hypothetical protein
MIEIRHTGRSALYYVIWDWRKRCVGETNSLKRAWEIENHYNSWMPKRQSVKNIPPIMTHADYVANEAKPWYDPTKMY